jgi:hypothetical protein
MKGLVHNSDFLTDRILVEHSNKVQETGEQ